MSKRLNPAIKIIRHIIRDKTSVRKKRVFMIFADEFLQCLPELTHIIDALNLSRPL